MAKQTDAVWTKKHVETLAPDAVSIPAAQKVLKKGGFGTVEPTADGRGWWVVCRGLSGTYQVSVQRNGDAFDCRCNCMSYKDPCKHALALLLYLVEHPELRTEPEAPKTAATDFEALVRAVFANPDEDTPRLAFADFLEENDQPDRAALIRYQCEQSRLKRTTARYKELTKLTKELATKLRAQIGAIPEGVHVEFRRGFIRLHAFHPNEFADSGSLPARFLNLFRDGWVEALVGSSIRFSRSGLHSNVLPLVAQIGELDVSLLVMADEALVGLASDTAPARESGRLARVKVHSRNRKAFARLVGAQQGEAVDLGRDLDPVRVYDQLIPRTFDQLRRFGRFDGARDLAISGPFGETELTALLTADLSNLRHLRLYGWNLTRDALKTLGNSPALAKLWTLSVQVCGIQAGGVTALVNSPLFKTLKTLDLSFNNFGARGITTLVNADVPTALRKLALLDFGLSAADKKRLRARYKSKLQVSS